MKPYILVVLPIALLQSCCEKCDLEFREHGRAFLPYGENQLITFLSGSSSETLTFHIGGIIRESEEKECSGFPERHCVLSLTQKGESVSDLGTDFVFEISTFKDNETFLLSLNMVTSETKYQYLGTVYSGSDVMNEFLPDLDSLVTEVRTFKDVYHIQETAEPLVPESLNRVTEFYYTKQQGIVVFKTKDGNTWILSDD